MSVPPTSVPPTPPGWPTSVRPPQADGWQDSAVSWLLDQCPADYRRYAAWRKHPVALAWVATRHVKAQLEAMRQCYRDVRVELADQVPTEGLTEILSDIEAEGLRLRASAHSAQLLYGALQGKRFVPRLRGSRQ